MLRGSSAPIKKSVSKLRLLDTLDNDIFLTLWCANKAFALRTPLGLYNVPHWSRPKHGSNYKDNCSSLCCFVKVIIGNDVMGAADGERNSENLQLLIYERAANVLNNLCRIFEGSAARIIMRFLPFPLHKSKRVTLSNCSHLSLPHNVSPATQNRTQSTLHKENTNISSAETINITAM